MAGTDSRISFFDLPKGCNALFFVQIFATMGYAVLYSSLVLYMTGKLGMSAVEANLTMGAFIAFNYSLHLIGGYFGGKLLSYRSLFMVGMFAQLLGCISLIFPTTSALYWGLALFLTGSGLNVTCINMMLSQRLSTEDPRREAAFLWNYSGMNLGFFLGFSLAGYFHLTGAYGTLFLLSSIGNVIAMLILLINWKNMPDTDTPLTQSSRKEWLIRNGFGLLLIFLMVPIVHFQLQHTAMSNAIILITGACMAVLILYWAIKLKEAEVRNKLYAYLILSFSALVFWSLYQIAPMGLTIFAEHNVNRQLLGMTISPQWIQNINTVVIVFGAPLMISLMSRLREKGYDINIPNQFATSLILIGIGFLAIPLGISFAGSNGLTAFKWIAVSYVFQSLGELLLSPIGYAMIARLSPEKLQGVLMGTWMMISGVAGILSSQFSNMAINHTKSSHPVLTNPGYQHIFSELGIAAVLVGIILYLIRQKLNYLIYHKNTAAAVTIEESDELISSNI